MHARVGKQNYNSIDNDQSKIQPLMRHFEYHLELGEVRATRTVSTLVDGMQGRTNRDNDDEAIFLPRYMGYRNCYKRYMASLGYNVRTTGSGVTIVEPREDGEPEDPSEYVSFPSYFYKWKEHFPQLRVSKAMEDICQYCYAFSNRHRYLSNRAIRHDNGTGDEDNGEDDDIDVSPTGDDEANEQGNSNDIVVCSLIIEGENGDGNEQGTEGTLTAPSPSRGAVNLNTPEAAWRENDEERELMLVEAAEHIKMARAQRALYQANVELAVHDASANKDHEDRVYTFVVDFGQIM